MKQPNYKKIYIDMISRKFPEKLEDCRIVLNKSILNSMDIIDLQKKLFGTNSLSTAQSNQLHKSYDKSAILAILEYQKKHGLNNSELARHFKMSRNTVSRWKKLFS